MRKKLRSLLLFFDLTFLVISPIAVMIFLILLMIGIDYFGQHAQLLLALEKDGINSAGTIAAYDAGDDTFLVVFDQVENDQQNVFLYTKYYSNDTIRLLENDRRVKVRYLLPESGFSEAILLDAYDEVKNYTGHLKNLFWPMLVCVVSLIVQPEILYLGLDDLKTKEHTKKSTYSKKGNQT
jgi:hypothetical protein